MADLGKNICNMIMCPQNTHPLFRSFGLGNKVDDPNGITRSRLEVELRKFFPDAQLKEFRITGAAGNGEFNYSIRVEGR